MFFAYCAHFDVLEASGVQLLLLAGAAPVLLPLLLLLQHLDHGVTHGGYRSFEDLLQMFDSGHGRC